MIQVSVQSDRVIRSCENYLAKHEARIQKEIDEAVVSHMEPRTGFLAPLLDRLFPPAKTREEAIRRMKYRGTDIFSEWQWIHATGSTRADRAKRMLALAQATETGFVVLDETGEWILNHE